MIKRILSISIIIFLAILLVAFISQQVNKGKKFESMRAFENVKYQMERGPRTLGSKAHLETEQWIIAELKKYNWHVETQETTINGLPINNIIAKRGEGNPWIILGSHYDSRLYADRDPDLTKRTEAVPGANDGASSVAILLEMARVLPKKLDKKVWLVFFDAEDYANINGNVGSLGAQYFVDQLNEKPDRVVILDMVGDKDLNIYMEQNSDPEMNKEIWAVASELQYYQFINRYRFDIIDDHIPFIRAGIKAVDVIDFNYPYWHTTQDTLDKISPESLKIVGETILGWLEKYP